MYDFLKADQKRFAFFITITLMKKILFVCLGNICRSPLAEGIMLHLNAKHNLALQIDSAGTANYHVGEAPDQRTVANAQEHGVDLSALRARQFEISDFDKFDVIYAMDKNNLRNLVNLARTKEHKNKLNLFLDSVNEIQGCEVPDPYYGTEKDFEYVFQLVYKACETYIRRF